MPEYQIAIVGAGPGGLSAAAHAAEAGVSHILLESAGSAANTIQRYQKGKHVMAEPSVLPLRSPMPFAAGSRERVLQDWEAGLKQHGVNIRYNSEVMAISGQQSDFLLRLKDGRLISAAHVIMAIGLQGNPRKLGVANEDSGFVQYTLDDPDEYRGETIVIVGAGDAAIENALALAENNSVILVNRRDEFARAKEGNLTAILRAIAEERINCFYNAAVGTLIVADPNDETQKPSKTCQLTLNTARGEANISCHRIIARLGAIAPREFIEACGISLPSADPNAIPLLSRTYESNVPGLYVIGALGGYPLIKQAMNQGYEVVEYILGHKVQPADHQLLADKFKVISNNPDVDAILDSIQQTIPLFAKVNPLQFREIMLDSNVRKYKHKQTVFANNDYTNSLFTVYDGNANVLAGDKQFVLKTGNFFGEMGLVSGRRRSATVTAGEQCILIETPRRTMNKLINSDPSVKRSIDEIFILRAIQSRFAPSISLDDLQSVIAAAQLHRYSAGQTLFSEGDQGDRLHLVRSGSLTVARRIGGRDIVLSYVPAGQYVGEMGLLGNTRRNATVRAAVVSETISIDSAGFHLLLEKEQGLREKIQNEMRDRLTANARMESQPDSGDILSFLMNQGLGEATDVLLIDESLCIRCDNCETACAETHGGTSRLNREAGPTFANVHVPTSCRHCEHPHCMKDCPPDAIHRSQNGEVFIADNCIGCGNCERNCPYGVIQMAERARPSPPLWQWLLFGRGDGPGQQKQRRKSKRKNVIKKAVKCDMCGSLKGGPACVRACPTGAAIRIAPDRFVQLAKNVR